ncbi:MAG: NUDIX hydrolase [Planctomycetota bacterium]
MKDYGIRGDPNYRLLEDDTAFQGRVVSVAKQKVRLPNGVETQHDVIRLPEAVAIVPILEEGGKRFVILVEQFRNSVQGYMHEVPAGVVDPGEEPEATAVRELREETGFEAGRMTHLASLLMIPGTSKHRLHYFLAQDLRVGEQDLEDTECLRVRKVPFDPLVQRLICDEPGSTPIVDAKTHLSLLHVHAVLERSS